MFPQDLLGAYLAEQHSVGEVFDLGLEGGDVLEADRVADGGAQLATRLVCDSGGDGDGGHPPGLRHGHGAAPRAQQPALMDVLRDLRGLAAARLADEDGSVVPADLFHQPLPGRGYGQGLALSLDLLAAVTDGGPASRAGLLPRGSFEFHGTARFAVGGSVAAVGRAVSRVRVGHFHVQTAAELVRFRFSFAGSAEKIWQTA